MTRARARLRGRGSGARRLSRLDRCLPLWVALAMAAGLALGSLIPSLDDWLDKLQVGKVSLPIAAGRLLMMYAVLARVRDEEIGESRSTASVASAFSACRCFLRGWSGRC